jgi:hypothetical protein
VAAGAWYGVASPTIEQFFEAYLIAFMFWAGISVGCLGILMLHHMVGGSWGYVIRRLLEAGATLMPFVGLLFLPIAWNVFSHHSIYEWTHHDFVAEHEIVREKVGYLNAPFFVGRVIGYFVVWSAMAFALNGWSTQLDATWDRKFVHRFKKLSGPGLVLYSLLVTFLGVDLVMSLVPEWTSSIFGLLTMVGQALSAFCLCVVVAHSLEQRGALVDVMKRERYHDLGNLILAFTLLWSYMSFSQYLISWSGNLPEEAYWYNLHLEGGWAGFAIALMTFHFGVPFLVLLSRHIKKRGPLLTRVALGLLAMHFVDLTWNISPTPVFGHETVYVPVLAIAMTIGIGGVWLALFAGRLRGRSLVPLYPSHSDEVPSREEVLHHG